MPVAPQSPIEAARGRFWRRQRPRVGIWASFFATGNKEENRRSIFTYFWLKFRDFKPLTLALGIIFLPKVPDASTRFLKIIASWKQWKWKRETKFHRPRLNTVGTRHYPSSYQQTRQTKVVPICCLTIRVRSPRRRQSVRGEQESSLSSPLERGFRGGLKQDGKRHLLWVLVCLLTRRKALPCPEADICTSFNWKRLNRWWQINMTRVGRVRAFLYSLVYLDTHAFGFLQDSRFFSFTYL